MSPLIKTRPCLGAPYLVNCPTWQRTQQLKGTFNSTSVLSEGCPPADELVELSLVHRDPNPKLRPCLKLRFPLVKQHERSCETRAHGISPGFSWVTYRTSQRFSPCPRQKNRGPPKRKRDVDPPSKGTVRLGYGSKINHPKTARFWSMFPFTRIPCVHILTHSHFMMQKHRQCPCK